MCLSFLRLVSGRRAVHPHKPARPTLADSELVAQMHAVGSVEEVAAFYRRHLDAGVGRVLHVLQMLGLEVILESPKGVGSG